MLERERHHETPRQRTDGDPADASNSLAAGQGFCHAVDDAINNAMSANSALFNAQTEQDNGQ